MRPYVLSLAALALVTLASAMSLQTTSITLSPKKWDSLPNGQKLYNDAQGGLYTDFPTKKAWALEYLWAKQVPAQISGTLVLSITVATTGNCEFKWDTETSNTCDGPPAAVRLLIWSFKNNDYAEYDRWWSNPIAFTLGNGSATLVVPLTPDQWSDVYGHFGNENADTLAGWNAAINNVSSLGMTFGGGCFFGHGVYVVNGTARFTINSYTVQ